MMTDMVCGYHGDRDETLVAYLYDDINAIDLARFEAHLAACARCRAATTTATATSPVAINSLRMPTRDTGDEVVDSHPPGR